MKEEVIPKFPKAVVACKNAILRIFFPKMYARELETASLATINLHLEFSLYRLCGCSRVLGEADGALVSLSHVCDVSPDGVVLRERSVPASQQ